ncbi:MAG: hypothetical protein Cons2KO_00280 [Congregibacter sp.]
MRHPLARLSIPLTLSAILAACGGESVPEQNGTDKLETKAGMKKDYSALPAAGQPNAKFSLTTEAVAELAAINDSGISGKVIFEPAEDLNRMQISVQLSGLTPDSRHGLHVHAVGDCGRNGAAAGGHFAPYDAEHGSPADSVQHHVGDLGNVAADEKGDVSMILDSRFMAFSGPASVLNKAVIVHAEADDLSSQPAGDSGSRVACGIIRAVD